MNTRSGRHPLLSLPLLLLSVVLLWGSFAQAWSYHSFSKGYSISVPDDWVQVPDEILTVRAPMLPALRNAKSNFDCAFQPQRNQGWFEYPYILVEVIPYSDMGIPQQVDDRQIASIVKTNTGLDPAVPAPASDPQVALGGGESEPLDAVLTFDRDGRRFIWSSTNTIDNVGLVRTRQWGIFGKDSLIQITLYEQGRGSDRLRDTARNIAASFKYEAGREYQPTFGTQDVANWISQLFSAPTMGMVVTIGCVGVAMTFAIVALITARRKLPRYEDYPSFEPASFERGSGH